MCLTGFWKAAFSYFLIPSNNFRPIDLKPSLTILQRLLHRLPQRHFILMSTTGTMSLPKLEVFAHKSLFLQTDHRFGAKSR